MKPVIVMILLSSAPFSASLGCLPDADLADERAAPGSGAGAALPPLAGGEGAPQVPSAMPAALVDDGMPPALGALTVEAGVCVFVRVSLNKDSAVHFVFQVGDQVVRLAGQRGPDGAAALRSPLAGLTPEASGLAWAEAVDGQGRASQTPQVPFVTPPARAPLLITEVLANPAGSEYTQEFVELLNVGAEPLPLDGLAIEDAAGSDALPAVVLPAGARALLVAEAFDVAGATDPAPAPDVLLVRLSGRIGRDGLANGGEAVTLRGPTGQVVSHYGGWVDASASSWNGRSVHRVPQDDPCDDPRLWTDRPQPPSPGW